MLFLKESTNTKRKYNPIWQKQMNSVESNVFFFNYVAGTTFLYGMLFL